MSSNYNKKTGINESLASGLLPSREGYLSGNNRQNHKVENSSIDEFRRFGAGSPHQTQGRDDRQTKVHDLNKKLSQDKANAKYEALRDKYFKLLNHTDVNFPSFWKDGVSILEHNATAEVKNITGSMMLSLLNYASVNFDRYQNDIPLILRNVSIDVRIWYFFETSKFYFHFLSTTSAEIARYCFSSTLSQGKYLLDSDKVKRTVKNDIAEQLLRIIDLSVTDVVKDTLNLKQIYAIADKFIINDIENSKLEYLKLEEYDFSFYKQEFDYNKIRSTSMIDESQVTSNKYVIKQLSKKRIFKFSYLLGLIYLIVAAVLVFFC